MKNILLFIGIMLSINNICFSQDKITYNDYDSISEEITALSEKEEYGQIVKIIDNINPNDSIYLPIQVTKSYYLIQQKKYEEAVKVCDEGLKSPNRDDSPSFFLNKALSYWYLENKEEALNTLDEGLKEFPKSYNFYFYKGVFHDQLEDYSKALEMYKLSAVLNPYNPDIHLKIGNICYKQHQISQALMCFNTYLLLNPDGQNSFDILNSINELLARKNSNEKVKGLSISKDDKAFFESDLIINNRIALRSDYEIDNKINIAFVRQNHALFETLKTFTGKDGFWDKTYVKLYKWIYESDNFDNFVYTTNYSIQNKKYKKIVNKNEENIISFLDQFHEKWTGIFEGTSLLLNSEKQPVSYYYNNNRLGGIGSKKDNKAYGNWEYYDEAGKLNAKGEYDGQEKRTGKWIWYYNNSNIKEIANYKEGKLEGSNIGYHLNGKVKYETGYSNDSLNGPYKYYNKYGALEEDKVYKKNTLEGPYNSFHQIGKSAKEYVVAYTNDKPEGVVTKYFGNGKKEYEVLFENGLKQKVEKNYYANGKLGYTYNYVDGKFSGSFKSYNKHGTLIKEGEGLEGENIGLWKTYYPSNTLKIESNYKNGKLDGDYFEYSPEGKLHFQYKYRKDELIAYKFFDDEGKLLKEADKKGGKFFYESFTINGIKTTEGLYDVSGGKVGEWKFYTDNGTVYSKGIYSEGKAQGEHTNYYSDGKVKSITTYKDDALSGYYVSYYYNGKIESQGWYLEDQKDKEWRDYYTDGTLKSISYYHKGELNGVQKHFSVEGKCYYNGIYDYGSLNTEKFFDRNGKLYQEIDFKNSESNFIAINNSPDNKKLSETSFKYRTKSGPFVAYDYYGNIVVKGNYLNGGASGTWTWFYKNGNKRREGVLLNGEYQGIVTTYHENGNIENKYEYNLGELNSEVVTYAEDGKTVVITTEYSDNNLHGRKTFYSDEGKLQLIRFYKYNKLIGYSYLDKDGKELPMIEIENETAKIVSYYDNGNKAREMEFKNGISENVYATYDYNGQLLSKHNNIHDQYNGVYIKHFKNGKVKEELIFKDDERNGLSKKYYQNGNLKESINYLNDDKSGEAKYYDSKGRLVRVEQYFNGDIYDSKEI
ncbi:MAG: tetratricopeptide repeat protein [Bacteroidota bacterium]